LLFNLIVWAFGNSKNIHINSQSIMQINAQLFRAARLLGYARKMIKIKQEVHYVLFYVVKSLALLRRLNYHN